MTDSKPKEWRIWCLTDPDGGPEAGFRKKWDDGEAAFVVRRADDPDPRDAEIERLRAELAKACPLQDDKDARMTTNQEEGETKFSPVTDEVANLRATIYHLRHELWRAQQLLEKETRDKPGLLKKVKSLGELVDSFVQVPDTRVCGMDLYVQVWGDSKDPAQAVQHVLHAMFEASGFKAGRTQG